MDALTIYNECCKYPEKDGKITPKSKVKPLLLSDYKRSHAQSCDIALFTPSSYWGGAIARHTGSPGYNFCHVEGIWICNGIDEIFSCGYEEGKGGTARPLRSRIEKNNGMVHIFRVPEEIWQARADTLGVKVEVVKDDVKRNIVANLGYEYLWNSIYLQFLWLLPFGRILLFDRMSGWFTKLVEQSASKQRQGICSQHIARSFEDGGVTLIHKELSLVTPNDIAMSAFVEYHCTLVVPPTERKKIHASE